MIIFKSHYNVIVPTTVVLYCYLNFLRLFIQIVSHQTQLEKNLSNHTLIGLNSRQKVVS